MPVRNPEEMHRAWSEAFNGGDVEALVALYEPDAALMGRARKPVTGHAAIRAAYTGLLASKPRIAVRATGTVRAGDLALTYGEWTLTRAGAEGRPVEMSGRSAEVLRRGADGAWRYVIDDPYAG